MIDSKSPGPTRQDAAARASLAPLWRSRYLVLDQAVASFSNFLLMVLVGRWLGPSDYGVFALIVGSWVIVLGVADAIVIDPMMVLGEEADGLGPHITAALAVGAGAAVPYAIVAAAVGFTSAPAQTLVVLGVCLPALILQQLWRMVGFQRGRPLASTINDLVFLVVQVGALAVAFGSGSFDAAIAAGCWGLGAIAAATLGFWQFGGGPASFRRGLETIRRGRAIGDWLVLDFFVNRAGLRQAALFVMAAVAGTHAIGALQASINLMGPTNILTFGAASAALVRGSAEMRAGDPHEMARTTRIHGLALAAVVGLYGAAYGASAWWLIPAIYGASYRSYILLAPAVALQTLIYALDLVPTTRLRILRSTRLMFSTRAIFAPVALLAVWVLAATMGAAGVAVAVIALATLSTGSAWVALRRATYGPSRDLRTALRPGRARVG